MALLKATDLSVGVIAADLPINHKVSFSLEEGRVLGLIGESGAGKSMIAKTIARLLPEGVGIMGGKLEYDGRDVSSFSPGEHRRLLGREIAFIPQEPLTALNPVHTIGHQFDEHLSLIGYGSGPDRKARMLEMFEAVGLDTSETVLTKYPHQFSGGQLQRILIAMAFSSKPRLVIADEPTTALDVSIQGRVVELIAEMQRLYNTAVVFITHDLKLAAHICDDMMVLYGGRIVERGPSDGVFKSPRHAYTRCLQLSNPELFGERRPLFTMPDRMPGLTELKALTGCRFAPRCPIRTEACSAREPELSPTGMKNHDARCIHSDQVRRISTQGLPLPELRRIETGDTLLIAQNVGKRYTSGGGLFRKRKNFDAARDINLSIRQGEFVGVVGESGSGKSTLARMAVGMDLPTSGNMILCGDSVSDQARDVRRRRVENGQMVFQDPHSALNPRRRVGSIVSQALEARGVDHDERMVRATELLREVGLSAEMATRYPSQMSGGQKQRVNIARALCVMPQLLVADEIVSGLDVSVQAQLLNLLSRLREEMGFGLLLISHDLAVVRYICERVVVMYQGQIVESGWTEEVFADPQHDYTRRLLASVPGESVPA